MTPRRPHPVRLFAAALAGLALTTPVLASHGGGPGGTPGSGQGSSGRGSGRIIPVLADGTLREPSVDRAQGVDAPDSLAAHRLEWDVTLAGGSFDRVATLDNRALIAGHVGLTYGLGGGADVSLRVESWARTRLDLPDTTAVEEASGAGPTTLALGRTVSPATWGGARVRYGGFVRFAGVAGNPGAQKPEYGAVLALGHALGESSQIAVSAIPAWVGNAADDGHHAEVAAGIVLTRDAGDHASLWLETVSVSSNEPARPWLGVVDAGLRLDLASRIGVTLGASAGSGAGRKDFGLLGSVNIHG